MTIERKPKEPIKEGYKFEGWYKEKECINEWDFENDMLSEILGSENGNIVSFKITRLFAKWKEIK